METTLLRFLVVWIVLHIVLYFVERYRFKHSDFSWRGFKREGMLDITYIVWILDQLVIGFAIIGGLIYWIVQPTLI